MMSPEPVEPEAAETRTKIMTVRLTPSAYTRLHAHAGQRGMRFSDWVRFACEEQFRFETGADAVETRLEETG